MIRKSIIRTTIVILLLDRGIQSFFWIARSSRAMTGNAFIFLYSFTIFILLIIFSSSFSFAQMGHGMMREGHMGTVEKNTETMTASDNAMQHGRIMSNMMTATKELSNIMIEMSELMGKMSERNISTEGLRRHRMSEIMKDLASEIYRISYLLDKGTATEEDLMTLKERMQKMRQQMWDIVN